MFTQTSDCRDISTIRYSNKETNLIPSIQFSIEIDGVDSELLIALLDFGDTRTRFISELLYLSAIGAITENELMEYVNVRLNEVGTESQLFQEITELRNTTTNREISLNLSKSSLEVILGILSTKGNLSFVCGMNIKNCYNVSGFSDITFDYLMDITKGSFRQTIINLSRRNESLGLTDRFLYPEDWFINPGHKYLNFINTMSGGEYWRFRTLKQAYSEDKYFSSNPDLFNQVHCACGGELVVRIMNGEYTLMSCTNHYCYEKYAFVLADFAQKLGIVGLGPGKFNDMCRAIFLERLSTLGDGTVNLQILLRPENEIYFGNAGKQLWYDFLDAIEEYNGTLSDLIEIMSLPYIASNAAKIVTGDLLKNPVVTPDLLLERSNSQGKRDIKFVLSLWLYFEDIKFVATKLVKNLNLELVDELPIYITEGIMLELDDGTTMKYKKNEFIDLVNMAIIGAGNNTTKVKLKKSLTKECIALIADQSRSTGSCDRARNYQIPILTSREFLKQLGGGAITRE